MKPKLIDIDEWLYKGNFIQKRVHPELVGKYQIFKNDKKQTHVDVCNTFKQAIKICNENESNDNYLKF